MSLYLSKIQEHITQFSKINSTEKLYELWESTPVVKNHCVIEWIDRGYFSHCKEREIKFIFGNADNSGCKLWIPLPESEVPIEWKEDEFWGNQIAYYGLDTQRMFYDMQSVERMFDCKITFNFKSHVHKKNMPKLQRIIHYALDADILNFETGDVEIPIYSNKDYNLVKMQFHTQMTWAIQNLIKFLFETNVTY